MPRAAGLLFRGGKVIKEKKRIQKSKIAKDVDSFRGITYKGQKYDFTAKSLGLFDETSKARCDS